jgi:hypothetical protein
MKEMKGIGILFLIRDFMTVISDQKKGKGKVNW